ncbi:hypothetical protein C8245_22875 [Paracidovorax avenae]|nr:hypothetical protein C8245_22875 [Paracidovorax avenae]
MLEGAGVRFKDAQQALDDMYSPAQQEANRRVREADGFVGTAKAMLENPSTIATGVGESLPQMLGGAGVARGLLKAAPAIGPVIAGALGEGVVGAGSAAEQIREQTADGLLTPAQAGLAAASGMATAGLGAAGGRVAQRLGIGDVDTMLAQGGARSAGTASARSAPRQAIEGALAEGVLEELPQSVSEQALQNIALDRPVDEGLGAAAAQGLITGAAMGAGGGAVGAMGNRAKVAEEQPSAVNETPAEPAQVQPLALPAPTITVGSDGEAETAADRNDRLQRINRGDITDVTPVRESVRPSEAMGLDPAAGAMSAAAALAVDSGASAQMQQAVRAQETADGKGAGQGVLESAAPEALQQEPKADRTGAIDGPEIDQATGEIAPQGMAAWSDEQLSAAFRSAQSRPVRIQLAEELGRRRGERQTQATQSAVDATASAATAGGTPAMTSVELAAQQIARDSAEARRQRQAAAADQWGGMTAADRQAAAAQAKGLNAIARRNAHTREWDSLNEKHRLALTDVLSPTQKQSTNEGVVNGAEATQAQQATAQPAEAGAAPAARAAAVGLTDGTPTPSNAGAQAAPARGQKGPAPGARAVVAPAPATDPAGEQWTRMTKVERQAIAQLTDVKPVLRKNLPGAAWENLNVDVKRKLAAAMQPLASDGDAPVATAAQSAATSPVNSLPEPTPAQKEAGNYQKGHVRLNGHDISIENPAGSRRRPEWPPLQNHYGYIKGTKGADKDHVDVFMTDRAQDASLPVFVLDQMNRDGTFDEHKVVMGAADEAEARNTYLGNYEKGWTGLGGITQMTQEEFKDWVRDPAKTKRRAAEPPRQPPASAVEPARDSAGNVIQRPRLTGDDRIQPPRARPGEAPATTQAKAEVVAYMNGDIDRPTLMQRLEAADLPEGVTRAITQRLQDDGPTNGEIDAMVARKAAKKQAVAAPAVKETAPAAETVPQRMKRAKAEKAAAAAAPRAMSEEGRAVDGQPILPGDTFATSSGRTTTAYPARKGERHDSQWLIENATAEAESRGDTFNAPTFRATKPLKSGQLTTADRESMLSYLFGDQPAVVPSVLKPLGAPAAAPSAVPAEPGAEKPRTVPEKMKEAKAKRESKAVREAREAEERRAAYFTPGNVVRGYGGGFDRVVSYQPTDADGRWSVTVREVQKDEGGAWADKAGAADRTHGTEPSKVNYATGPAARMKIEAAANPATAAPAAPAVAEPAAPAQTMLERHNAVERGINAGTLDLDQYKQTFDALVHDEAAVLAELKKLTKEDLLLSGGAMFAARYRNEKKDDIIRAGYRTMLDSYALGRQYGPTSYVMSSGGLQAHHRAREAALRELVHNTTQEDLAARAAEVKAARDEYAAKRRAVASALENPKTLQDFRAFMRHWLEQGETSDAAFLRLTPEQRQAFDALEAESTREAREKAKADARNAGVRSAGETTAGEIIGTKHTKHGHDLFVIQLADRVSREDYETLNNSARRLGGNYSSFRGSGAIPGFQFRSRESAEAFQKLVSGDTSAAQDVVQARRDAFQDDRSQTTVERLRAMADAIDAGADEQLSRERKTNTARRARMAGAAEEAARNSKAYAGTMRNLADAIEAGRALFLDGVRTKTQLSQLQQAIGAAKAKQLLAEHGSWAAAEQHKHEPANAQTVDFAEFPRFGMFRSDLAGLARQLLEIEGGKKLGAALQKVADDVTDAYTDWAKANLRQVSQFGRAGELADFANKADAERAIKRSGLVGKAVVLAVKRGQNRVVLSPGEAMQRGLWQGDGDKRINLSMDFVQDLVKLGKRRGSNAITIPWQLESTLEKRQRLQRMGIQTPAEYRSALRELVELRETSAAPDRIKELERSMVGRQSDGLDFFPTPSVVTENAVDAADIQPGMDVLEPSAGMGHIADYIREQTGIEPDVVELSGKRRELLEAKGYNLVGSDFLELDGKQYDRIVMNPPFSDGRDIQHVRHAFGMLKPGGRLVAIMSEGAFFQSNKRAAAFREWLDTLGATNEKLPDGAFMDSSLPVNTGVSARMVVIDKPLGTEATPAAGPGAEAAAFSRTGSAPGGQNDRNAEANSWESDERLSATTALVNALTSRWERGPDVVVVRNMQDRQLPDAVREEEARLSRSAKGQTKGFYYNGQVFLVSDALANPKDIAEVLFHESLGHYGLRRNFGERLTPILRQIVLARRADVAAKARAYGLDMRIENDRLTAAEEILAEMAEQQPDLGFVKRAIAAVRTWLRENVPGFKGLALTNQDIVANYIIPARNFVTRSRESVGAAVERSMPVFSRGGGTASQMSDYVKQAREELNKSFNVPGKLSWWHKTVGTMYNLAQRSPAFKGVFDAAQGFIDDVSHYAADAADMAPKLLPKLEEWSDIRKRPVSASDNKAVAKPVFEGTLTWARDAQGRPVQLAALEEEALSMTVDQKAQRLLKHGEIDPGMLRAWQGMPLSSYESAINSRYSSRILSAGVVWSDAELKDMFGLNDEQVALYREFRSAVDRSLDTMGRADMLRFGGNDLKPVKAMVMDAPDIATATQVISDHLRSMAREQPDRADQILDTLRGVVDRADKVEELQRKGYAPLSRFGQYTVDVVQNGERQYFGLFETAREAAQMAEQMEAEFGRDAVTRGTLSNEEFKLFAGITPESLELFGNMLGLESEGDKAQDLAFQEYLKRTKTNRSAMKRLIHRKGIAGYSEDVGRVLASFIYSNSRQTAAGLHMGDLGKALTDIPKEQGELKDAAVRLAEYVKNPQEEAQAIRGLLFAQYLGGSIASAFVNMTQPIAVTFPWLSQYGGARKAAAALGKAARDMGTRNFKYEPGLAEALKAAEDDGTVSPQEVHQLMAQARGAGSLRAGDGTRAGDARAKASNAFEVLKLAWGKVFGAAEQVNRRVSFIAAYRTAVERGDPDPSAFARRAVIETQFQYSKANKMEWGRGAVGGTLMTFKTYSIAYVELLHRMWTMGGPEGKRAALVALGMLALMGGAGGLPFVEDVEDAATGLGQLMGYNFNAKQAKQELLQAVFGKALGDFVEKGITGLPGMPIDVSGRLGMGNLIPGTGLLQEKTNHTRDVLEIAGPAGDFVGRLMSGGRKILGGEVGSGLLEMSPVAVRNAAKGVDMAATGMYRDAKGYKVLDTNALEAAMKAIGFQPSSVATVQEANAANQQAKNFYNMKAQEIRAKWAAGIFEGNDSLVQEARRDIETWNAKNPAQRMVITVPSVLARVKEMRKSKDQRIADSAPKAMRAAMREEIAQRNL